MGKVDAKRIPYNPRADNAGVEPAAGDYVAFNYSGQIACGWIERIGRGSWGPIYVIERILPDEGTSRVKGGPKCVLVLERNTQGAEPDETPGHLSNHHRRLTRDA